MERKILPINLRQKGPQKEIRDGTRGKGHCQTHCINEVEVGWVCGPQMRCNELRDWESKMSVR